MDALAWIVWGFGGAAYIATLLLTSRAVMHRRLARVLAVVALVTLFSGTAAVGAPAPMEPVPQNTGQVVVSITVLPTLECTFTADGVVVRSNVPWVVAAKTAAGDRIVVEGEPTAGQHVALPDTAGSIEVCAR